MPSDEDFGGRLAALLMDEPLPPSTVDIYRAVSDGKRRRLGRYAASGVAVLALAVAVPIAIQSQRPQAPPVTRSADPSGECRVVAHTNGIRNLVTDPTGRYFGGYELGTAYVSDWYAAFWKDGAAQRIALPDGRHGVIRAINSSGVAVGDSNRPLSNPRQNLDHAFVYRDGVAKLLAGGEQVTVTSISDSGVIAGMRSVPDQLGRPVIWKSPDGERIDLPLPTEAVFGAAVAAVDDGSIVGMVTTDGIHRVAYRWSPDGTGEILTVPEASYVAVVSAGRHWVNGTYIKETGERGTFRYDLPTRKLHLIPDFHLSAQSSSTWILGYRGKYPVGGAGWPPNLPAAITDGTAWLSVPLPEAGRRIGLNSASADGKVITGVDSGPVEQQHRAGPEEELSIIWRCD